MKRKRARGASAFGAVLSTAWLIVTTAIDVANLPADSADAWKVVVSAPQYIPLGLVAACLMVLAWSIFWPERVDVPESESMADGPQDNVPGPGIGLIMDGTKSDIEGTAITGRDVGAIIRGGRTRISGGTITGGSTGLHFTDLSSEQIRALKNGEQSSGDDR